MCEWELSVLEAPYCSLGDVSGTGHLSRKLSVTALRGHLERVWEAVSVPVPQLILFIRQGHRLRKKLTSGFPGPATAASPGRVLGMQDLRCGIIQRTRKLEVDHQSILQSLGGSIAVPMRNH